MLQRRANPAHKASLAVWATIASSVCAAALVLFVLPSSRRAVSGTPPAPVTSPVTSSGRPKARGEKAFVLAVEIKFKDERKAEELVKLWAEVADYCHANEPFLYHYEIGKSDQDPLRYMIYERYRSKDDYLHAHKSSKSFLDFRPKMKALQDAGEVEVGGHSYEELGAGFV